MPGGGGTGWSGSVTESAPCWVGRDRLGRRLGRDLGAGRSLGARLGGLLAGPLAARGVGLRLVGGLARGGDDDRLGRRLGRPPAARAGPWARDGGDGRGLGRPGVRRT